MQRRSAFVLYGFGDCFISYDLPVIPGLWLPCGHLQKLGKLMIKHKTMCLFWLMSGFCLLLKLVNYSYSFSLSEYIKFNSFFIKLQLLRALVPVSTRELK